MSTLTIGFLVALAAVHAQPAPEMPENVARFWKRLSKAKMITYTMKYWAYDYFGSMSDPQPGSRIFYVQNTYEVKAQRPNRLSVSITPGIEREVIVGEQRQRQFNNYGDTLYVNNGRQSITCMAPLHIYKLGQGVNALAKDTNEYAVQVHTSWIFDEKPMDGYHLLPESLAASSGTVIYTLTDPKSLERQQRIYFDRKTGDLVQTSDFEQDDKGIWNEYTRQEFRFWDFDARLPRNAFSVRPPRMYISHEEYSNIHNIEPAKPVAK